ncbi:MAG: PadR family transcriptional regulator [Solirubrobacterales bacterium]
MELSPTAYVILGMLRTGPKSGYEIKALVDNSTRFFWAASYGQIYPELRRLADAGLVEGADAPRDGRRRTVYKLTPEGRKELRAWLREPPTTFETRDEGLLKLFFAGALPPQDAVKTLQAMRERSQETLGRLREVEPKAIAAGGYPLMVLRGGIELNEWYSDWCERMQRQVLAEAEEKEAS